MRHQVLKDQRTCHICISFIRFKGSLVSWNFSATDYFTFQETHYSCQVEPALLKAVLRTSDAPMHSMLHSCEPRDGITFKGTEALSWILSYLMYMQG